MQQDQALQGNRVHRVPRPRIGRAGARPVGTEAPQHSHLRAAHAGREEPLGERQLAAITAEEHSRADAAVRRLAALQHHRGDATRDLRAVRQDRQHPAHHGHGDGTLEGLRIHNGKSWRWFVRHALDLDQPFSVADRGDEVCQMEMFRRPVLTVHEASMMHR